MTFKELSCLLEYSEEVFQHFYDELLSNKVFAKHFDDEAQVQALLEKQKSNFQDALTEPEAALFQRYYHVGVVHYEHNIAYEVFLSGTRVLRDAFQRAIDEHLGDSNIALLNTTFFESISEAMAKGYLDNYLKNERADLSKILHLTKSATFGTEKKLLIKHYQWMLDLLTAVDEKKFGALDELVRSQEGGGDTLYAYIEEHMDEIGPMFGHEELERIRFRILANTENIFFYIKRKLYSEALSLIINILEIYKLTLLLDNVISNILVRKAESVINEKAKLAEIDPLTNVMNRRKFEDLLEKLLDRSQRTALGLTITIMDIDNFKQVNDKYGHQMGDQVLIDVTRLISKLIRKNDHLVRYGGEEFVIISSESDLEGVATMAEKIRRGVEAHTFPEVGKVTLSLGLAQLMENDDPHRLFQRADEKLYQAKAGGKNRVCY